MEEYVPAKQAAEALGISYAALLMRARRKKIKSKKLGWSVLIAKSELCDAHQKTVAAAAR